jgi:hypothetical protein
MRQVSRLACTDFEKFRGQTDLTLWPGSTSLKFRDPGSFGRQTHVGIQVLQFSPAWLGSFSETDGISSNEPCGHTSADTQRESHLWMVSDRPR